MSISPIEQKNKRKRQEGQSLLELIVAMAIFSLIGAAMISMVTGSFIGLQRGGEETQAQALAQEGIEAVRAIRDRAWNENVYSTSSVATLGNEWVFSGEGTTETIGQFTRVISFDDVCRDSSDAIVDCPAGHIDPHTKEVVVDISWEVRPGISSSVRRSAYLTNWDSSYWTQTDWSGGSGQPIWSDETKYDTDNYNIDIRTTGEAKLGATVNSNWEMSGGSLKKDTSDGDFDQGTFSNTVRSDSGDSASVILDTGYLWAEHADSGVATTQTIRDISVVSPSDIWAVGSGGKILHYDGTNWSEFTDTGSQTWYSIDMVSATDGWVVGSSGKIYHYDGTSWTQFTDTGFQTWYSIKMVSATDGWVVGNYGEIYHWDGSSWTLFTDTGSETWYAINMVSATDGWVVGNYGKIYHYDGSTWSQFTDTGSQTWYAIDMVSATDGWVVGNYGEIYHWDGTSWTLFTDTGSQTWYSVLMLSSTEGWLVGSGGSIFEYANFYKSSGTFSSRIFDGGSSTTTWNSLYWTDVLPAGSDVTIATRTGNTPTPDGSWSSWSSELTNSQSSSISSPDGRYFQYRASLTRGNLPTETPSFDEITIIYNSAVSQTIRGISVVSPSDIWAVGSGGKILHYDGTNWSEFTDTGSQTWYSIDMVSATDGWVVGSSGQIYHWDGTSWNYFTDSGRQTWYSIDMVSATDGWVVGSSGKIYHYDGTSWTQFTDTGFQTWYAIDILSATDGWVVGNSGKIYHYDGTSWTQFTDTGFQTWYSIKMVSATDGWVVGNYGEIYHWDGSSWTLFTDTGSQTWYSVFMSDTNDGWVVGSGGDIYLWNGTIWVAASSPTSATLRTVAMLSPFQAWAAGNSVIIKLLITKGIITSSAFDTGAPSKIQVMGWDETVPSCSPACGIKFELSAAPDSGGSPGTWTDWYGADGAGTYFATSTGSLVPVDLNDNQWVRYRATLTGDGMSTPVLEESRVNYKWK